ncbi:MAG: cyclic nucleotide-binding domain-containing protein [bacterium]|nr:cyclic nucleotide-binding domain-containing protein [bacterium]
MDGSDVSTFLQETPLFEGLSPDELKFVAHRAKIRQYYPDETIVYQGKPSDTLYLLRAGIVAVTKMVPGAEKAFKLAYIMPGRTFGEVGILENSPRSANVVAVTDVDTLIFRREDFLEILHRYSSVAIALARSLGEYLLDAARRRSVGDRKVRLILVFSPARSGGTSVAHALAAALAKNGEEKVSMTEYPNPQKLAGDYGIGAGEAKFSHPKGYDVYLSYGDAPEAARTVLMLDEMMGNYTSVIVGLGTEIDHSITNMMEYATQIVLVAPPEGEAWEAMEGLQDELRSKVSPDRTTLFTLVNRPKEELKKSKASEAIDFDIPFSKSFPPLSEVDKAIPRGLARVVGLLVDRLDRTHQLGVFIPTTIDIDATVDTKVYVDKTLAFLGDRFGGATCSEASGVWKSDEVGLVSETVYVVKTYATQGDLNTHLDSVVDYVKEMGIELRQEAMALEVDQKLILL